MILDGKDIGLGKIEISDSIAQINRVETPIKKIEIFSKDDSCSFTMWTKQEYQKFNDLELNKKVDILDYIDDYDIDFNIKDKFTINSRENAKVYFTRIDTDKYVLNVEIDDFDKCIIGKLDNKNLKIEAIIDFSKNN